MKDDLISRRAAIDELQEWINVLDPDSRFYSSCVILLNRCIRDLKKLPSVKPKTCEECKHLGKWENEIEYGYPSPCTYCKRRADDHYEI